MFRGWNNLIFFDHKVTERHTIYRTHFIQSDEHTGIPCTYPGQNLVLLLRISKNSKNTTSFHFFSFRDGPFDIQGGGLGFFLATGYFFLSFSTTSYFFQK